MLAAATICERASCSHREGCRSGDQPEDGTTGHARAVAVHANGLRRTVEQRHAPGEDVERLQELANAIVQ